MKKLLTSLLIVFSIASYAQISCYSYKVKLQGIENPQQAKMPTDYIRLIFKTNPTFNDSTDQFEFTSTIPVVENEFKYMMHDDGYEVLYFNKIVCVSVEPKGKIIYTPEGDR